MPRAKTEYARIRIITATGSMLETEAGSATRGMEVAFSCLPRDRRERLLEKLQAEHAKLLEQDGDFPVDEAHELRDFLQRDAMPSLRHITTMVEQDKPKIHILTELRALLMRGARTL